jgi:hypothetical protein
MEKPANAKAAFPQKADDETLRVLRHDINNQLSNILLALEQLRYEIPNASEDCRFYMDTISTSAEKITSILTTPRRKAE